MVEFAPPKPIEVIAPITEEQPVVRRTLPRAAAVVATARPAAFAEGIPPAAQIQGGALSGTITDQTGAVIPGVTLNMTAQSTNVTRRTLSNSSGNFAFTELPPDSYFVTAELPGFQNSALSYVLSAPGSSAKFIIPMRIAPMMTTVSIVAQSPPGLRCFSIFGAIKSDGTPFTEADCPGGTIVVGLPPRSASPPPAVPNSIGVVMIAPPAAAENWPIDPVNGRRLPIRVGGDIQAASLLSHANPTYPTEARNKGVEGVVSVAAIVSVDGHLQSLKITGSSNPLLEASVIETLQGWTYKPALLNKEPVEAMTVIILNFTLNR